MRRSCSTSKSSKTWRPMFGRRWTLEATEGQLKRPETAEGLTHQRHGPFCCEKTKKHRNRDTTKKTNHPRYTYIIVSIFCTLIQHPSSWSDVLSVVYCSRPLPEATARLPLPSLSKCSMTLTCRLVLQQVWLIGSDERFCFAFWLAVSVGHRADAVGLL